MTRYRCNKLANAVQCGIKYDRELRIRIVRPLRTEYTSGDWVDPYEGDHCACGWGEVWFKLITYRNDIIGRFGDGLVETYWRCRAEGWKIDPREIVGLSDRFEELGTHHEIARIMRLVAPVDFPWVEAEILAIRSEWVMYEGLRNPESEFIGQRK